MSQQQTARQLKKKVYIIENLDCANCAAAVERKIAAMPEVQEVSLTFATRQLRITAENPSCRCRAGRGNLPENTFRKKRFRPGKGTRRGARA